MIKFYCPHCSQKLGVPDEYANRRVRCSKCNQPSKVPQPLTTPQPVELEVLEPEPQTHTEQLEPVRHSPAPPSSQPSSGFAPDLDIGYVEESPNLDALAAARAQRTKQQRKSMAASRPKASRSSEGGSRLSGLAIGAGKIPLSIALSLAFGIGVCIIWTIVARLTGGLIFVYFAVGVSAASAYGLVILTEHRNVGLGIAAIFIGFFCILIGKGMIAKWAIMPDEEFQTAMAENFDEAFGSMTYSQMSQAEKAELLNSPSVIYNMGVMDLWTQSQIDEETSQMLSFYSFAYQIDPTAPGPENYEAQHAAVLEHIEPWDDTQKSEMLNRHYDTYLQKCENWVMDSGIVTGLGFIAAFIGAFSLWDLIILPISAITAFKIANGSS